MAKIRGFTLENIESIKILFSTFDTRIGSAKDFFRRVSSTKLQQTNPKCQIKTTITEDLSNPTVEVKFNDNSKLMFDCIEIPVLKMVEDINVKSRSLQKK